MGIQETKRIPIKLESLRIEHINGNELIAGEVSDSGSSTIVQIAEIDRETGECLLLIEGQAVSVDPIYSGYDFIAGVSQDGHILFDQKKAGGWTNLMPPLELETNGGV